MSWERIDLLAVESGGPPEPTLSGIGYPGTLTLVYGEPETLKSWLELVVCLEAIQAGRHAVWVDFETSASSTIDRLRALGATDEEIGRFVYLQPGDPLTDPAERGRVEHLVADLAPAVVTVDAMAGALALHGLKQNDGDDIERLYSVILRPFRTPTTAVRIIDHVVKDRETQGRWPTGSQRKLGGADVGLRVELVKPLSRGGSGSAKIRVTKDRPGGLPRPYVAELSLNSDAIDGRIGWTLAPAAAGGRSDSDERNDWRPTWYMEQVSRVLEAGGPLKRGEIRQHVGRNRDRVIEAINHLIVAGNISETVGPRGAKMCTLVEPFRDPSQVSRLPDPSPGRLGTTDGGGAASSRPDPSRSIYKGTTAGTTGRDGSHNPDDPETARLLELYGDPA